MNNMNMNNINMNNINMNNINVNNMNNTNMNNTNVQCCGPNEMTYNDFRLVVKWYEYSDNLKHVIASPILDSTKNEYYLIDSNWINEFKKIFKYDIYKGDILNFGQSPLNDDEIFSLYSRKVKIPIDNDKMQILNNNSNNKVKKTDDNLRKLNINYYYDDFIILNKNILEEFEKKFTIAEKPKCDILLGNSIFIIYLKNNVIEVGKFYGIYNYEYLLLIIYEEKKEAKEEIQKIKKSSSIDNYLDDNNIKIENIPIAIEKPNGKKIKFIDLRNINDNIINNINNINNINIANSPSNKTSYNINNKIGLENKDNKSSGMNAIIQLLTSIEDLINYLVEEKKKEDIEKFNHIYILSSYLLKFINKLYSNIENKKKDDSNLEVKMKIVLNFMSPGIIDQPIENLFYFILNTIHDELNESNLKKTQQINLESYPSPLGNENTSLSTFNDYYKKYYISLISNIFNWKRKKVKECNCGRVCSFQAFPVITFDIDKTQENMIISQTSLQQELEQYRNNPQLYQQKINEYQKQRVNQSIDLRNCFEYYVKKPKLDNNESIICKKCNMKYQMKYLIYESPKYFIIILNRKQKINCNFYEQLQIENYIENSCQYKTYELIGALINTESNQSKNHYIAVIKKNNLKYIKFDDSNVTEIDKEELLKNYQLQTKILIYKGK